VDKVKASKIVNTMDMVGMRVGKKDGVNTGKPVTDSLLPQVC
jgi:hypothetical protein